MRRTLLRVLVAAAALLLGLVPAASARPSQDGGGSRERSQDVRLDLAVGLDGHTSPSRAYPVTIDLTSPRLLSGTLVVTVETDFGPSTIQQPVEVAASTTKRYVVTAPPGTSFGGRVLAAVRSEGTTIVETSEPVAVDHAGELVGVLPGLAAALDRATVPLALDVGVARLHAVPSEVLAEGPLALEVYDQIASAPGDLDDLSAVERAAIVTWVAQGGHLLVDAQAGAPAGLPEALDPAPGTYRTVGLGRVLLTGGVLAAGRWTDVLFPTPTQSMAEEGPIGGGMSFIGDITSALARDAGFRLPSIAALLFVLGVYVLVVGPVAWLVARRTGRARLLWVAVPLVAVLVTATLQVVGDDFKGSDEAVHLTMVESGPDGAIATSSVFVAARGRGGTTVDLPRGWQVASNPFFGGFDGSSRPTQRVGDGASVSVDPGSGGAAVVRSRGPVAGGGGLVVRGTSDADGVVRGTVVNAGAVELHDVAIFISRTAVFDVGDLAAGEEAEWEVDDATRFEFDASPEMSVWPTDVDPRMFGFDIGPNGERRPLAAEEDEPVSSISAFGDLAAGRGANFKPPGEAVAVGWSRAVRAPVRVGGAPVEEGRTGFVARTTVVPTGDRLSDTAATRFLLRGPDGVGGGGGVMVPLPMPPPPIAEPGGVTATTALGAGADIDLGNTGQAMFGFQLPRNVGGRPIQGDRLRMHLPAFFVAAQVWDGVAWVALPVDPRGAQEVDLPDGALVHGTVYLRVVIPFDRPPNPGRELVVYEAAA